MDTLLVVILVVVVYLAFAGWVHFDTTPAIFDDSQLRRTAKLATILPIIAVLFVIITIVMIVAEYWDYFESRKLLKQARQNT